MTDGGGVGGGDLLTQFREVTGCGSDDEARHYLAAGGGNLEAAVELYFASAHEPASAAADASTSANGQPVNGTELDDDVRQPIPRQNAVLVNQSYRQSYASRRRRGPTDSVFDRHRDFRAESEAQRAHMMAQQGGAAAGGQGGEKVSRLESLFQRPRDLMFQGTWDMARAAAEERGHWLLVNVQKADEFQCAALNRDVWSNDAVKELVNSNFVFWQTFQDEPDGQRFVNYYPVREYPYVCIVDPRTGELLSTVRTTDAILFCDTLTNFLERRPSLHAESPARTARPQPDEQVEGAASRKRGASTDVASLAAAEPQPKTTRLSVADTNGDVGSMPTADEFLSRSTQKQMQIENWQSYVGDSGDEFSFVIRFPNGARESLNLKGSTQTKALLLFVASKGFAPTSHDLVLGFPRRLIDAGSPTQTLADLHLNRQEIIHVERK